MAGQKKGDCKIVLVPADLQAEIEEQTLSYTEVTEVSCVQDRAKAHFKKIKPQKTPEQLSAQKQAFLAQIPEEQQKGITDALMEQALGMDMVEHVSLLSNATDNNFMGVTMYCDDEAVAVDLPLNKRASEMATCAGKPSEVRGDVFLARVFDNGDDFKRLDFALSEVSSSAAWVKEAYAQNERKRKSESAAATMARINRQSRAPVRVKELTPAEADKEEGNALFKAAKYQEAVEAYSRAIEQDDRLLSAYSNRAMAWLRLGDSDQALRDASHALTIDPTNVKALLRRATARENVGQSDAALADYREALQLESHNREAASKVEELEKAENLQPS